jgi:hypothetical protein
MKTTLIALCCATLFGCAGHDELGEPIGEPTAMELLDEQPWFGISPASNQVELTVRLNRGSYWLEDTARLDIDRGQLAVFADADGDLVIDALEFNLGDVVAGEKVISDDGLHLTDLHVYLKRAAPAAMTEWADDGDTAYARAVVDLTLGWALFVGPETYSLGEQALPAIEIDLGLAKEDGRLGLDLAAGADGVFWQWAGIIELADLRMTAHGTQLAVIK